MFPRVTVINMEKINNYSVETYKIKNKYYLDIILISKLEGEPARNSVRRIYFKRTDSGGDGFMKKKMKSKSLFCGCPQSVIPARNS